MKQGGSASLNLTRTDTWTDIMIEFEAGDDSMSRSIQVSMRPTLECIVLTREGKAAWEVSSFFRRVRVELIVNLSSIHPNDHYNRGLTTWEMSIVVA